ncbi:MAG TPA: DUF4124 domain-containing protein [Candidatus Polarisedimenticolaceae bacterium]|nr:DUF4124 domain-containing protein [Candidatus Polarisedimenticolaceae bacterium]
MRHISPTILLTLGLATTLLAQEEQDEHKIYTCTDASGETVYLDEPCDARPVRAKPKAAAPVAKVAKPSKGAPAPKARAVTRSITYLVPESYKPIAIPPPLKNVPWEPTWKAFVNAMSQGDRAAALRCLTSGALADLGPRIQSATPEAMREMVASFDRVIVEGDVGAYWSIRVLRAGARPKWVFFERTPRGEWKIAAI